MNSTSTSDPTQLAGFRHAMGCGAAGTRLHFVRGGSGPPVFLLHGFPQCWYEWRLIMPQLARRHDVIVVDLRGAGYSSCGDGDFSKAALAADLESLRKGLGLGAVGVAGHDVGAMVAYAWAAFHPGAVSRLALLEALIPGGTYWSQVLAQPLAWHVAFHASEAFPELLLAGREFPYIEEFIRQHACNQGAFGREDIQYFADAYARGPALRGAMGWYRALARDAEMNAARRLAKLTVPVLAIGADAGVGPLMVPMAQEFASDVRGAVIEHCGHWVPEERPTALAAVMNSFFD